MIRPTKYMDPDTCVLRVAAEVLTELRKQPAISLEECDEQVRARITEDARFNFVPALNLLYLLGFIDYNLERDLLGSVKSRV